MHNTQFVSFLYCLNIVRNNLQDLLMPHNIIFLPTLKFWFTQNYAVWTHSLLVPGWLVIIHPHEHELEFQCSCINIINRRNQTEQSYVRSGPTPACTRSYSEKCMCTSVNTRPRLFSCKIPSHMSNNSAYKHKHAISHALTQLWAQTGIGAHTEIESQQQ